MHADLNNFSNPSLVGHPAGVQIKKLRKGHANRYDFLKPKSLVYFYKSYIFHLKKFNSILINF